MKTLRFVCPLLLLGGALSAPLQAGATLTLASKSPFLPEGGTAMATPARPETLEYLGYIHAEGRVKFRVRDTARKASAFLALGESAPELEGLVPKHFDAALSTLTVEQGGRTITLPTRQGKIVNTGAPALPASAVPVRTSITMAPAVTAAVVVNPTPQQEAERLGAITAEIERRRAERARAAAAEQAKK